MDSNTPFPQANDLDKVLLLVKEYNYRTTNELMKLLEFTRKRQIDYYKNACVYLGLMKIEKRKYTLTKVGELISNESKQHQITHFLLNILKVEMILECYLFLVKNKDISDKYLLKIVQKYDDFKLLSESTKNRRLSTIKSWIKWINKNL